VEDSSLVGDGAAANDVETNTQLLVGSLVSSSTSTLGLDRGIGVYLPRACLSVTDDGATATYVFNGCLGPNGLRSVSGTLSAKYTVTSSSLELTVTGTNLTVNDAKTLNFTADAKISKDGADRKMDWKSSLTGTTAAGAAFSRTSESTTQWTLGEPCFALDGTSEGQVKQRDIKIEVDSYQRCKRGCPEAGGKISVTNVAKNKTISIAYDGTNHATYTNAAGKETTLTLLCVP
jgi:hypothetical protein